MTEFDFISWLRKRTPADSRVLVGPGDDCAVLRPPAGALLTTTDMLMDGVDFILADVGAQRVGRKALAVNLSDIAAMAGKPVVAFVSVALPIATSVAQELYLGISAIAQEFDVVIAGGDTNAWHGPLVISVTLLGEATMRGAVLRSGARPGDWLMATGSFGGSILGKHLDFTPRIREALLLHEKAELHAMIDVSDGLAADVHHLCEESSCGAILRAEAIPISEAATQMRDTKTLLDHALGDGEDFELAFAVSAEDGRRLLDGQPIPSVKLSHIGEFTSERSFLIEINGQRQPLPPKGYVHRFVG